MTTPLTSAHRSWRVKVFVATWLSYVGFYFCRQPFSSTKSEIGKEAQWGATTLGDIEAAYLIAYAVGQFLASGMGTKLGPRKNVLIGMALSVAVSSLMGITLDAAFLTGLVAVNGLAQATGWSGNVGTMAAWFHKHERGRVMGVWSTNFTVGSIASQYAMAGVLTLAAVYGGTWRWCFYAGAVVLALVWVQFYAFQRNRPEDVGLPPIDDPVTPVDEATTAPPPVEGFLGLTRTQWANILLVGGFYFFSKLIRYAVWGWAAYFLVQNYQLSSSTANVYGTAFSVAGLPGVYLTGYLSDKYFGSRRAGISTLMLVGMIAATGLLILFGDTGVGVFTILLAAVGFTLFGPDALMTGAAAIDIGGRRTTLATGIIAGFGALGPIVQALVIGRLYDAKGGDLTPVFIMLFGSAIAAAAFSGALVIRNRGGKGV
ncbi:MAG TPA: MFS transporter [Kofleriaceae bacterium]|nr:MFS transporter [Kofleriaceae bacterium]